MPYTEVTIYCQRCRLSTKHRQIAHDVLWCEDCHTAYQLIPWEDRSRVGDFPQDFRPNSVNEEGALPF